MEKQGLKRLFYLKIFFVAVLVFLQLWVLVGAGNSKTSYDIDETSSYTLANNRDGMIWYDNYGWIHAGTFQKFGATERFNFGIVWENQAMDCHPPLFYAPMYAISSTFFGRLSPWIGVLPNVLYHFITLWAIGYILHKITKRYYLSMCGVALFAFNPSVITYVAYIRMYAMANMWVALFACTVIQLYYEQETYNSFKLKKEKYKLWLCLGLFTALGGLTHYYFYFAAFFISSIVGLYWLIKKRWGILVKYCVTVLGGIGLAVAIFPAVISHLLANSHSMHALENLTGDDWPARLNSFWGFSPFGGMLTKVVITTAVLLLIQLGVEIYEKKLTGQKFKLETGQCIGLLGLLTALLYFGIVSKIATFIQQRYIVPIETIIIISFFLVWCYSIKSILSVIKSDLRVIIGFFLIYSIALAGGMSRVAIPKTIAPPLPTTFETYAQEHQSEQCVLFSPDYCGYINQNFMQLRYFGDIYLTTLKEDAMEDDVTVQEFDNVTTALVSASYMDDPRIKVWLDKYMPGASLVLREDISPSPYYIYTVKRE